MHIHYYQEININKMLLSIYPYLTLTVTRTSIIVSMIPSHQQFDVHIFNYIDGMRMVNEIPRQRQLIIPLSGNTEPHRWYMNISINYK